MTAWPSRRSGPDGDAAAADLARQAVLDRVLDQRLKDHARHDDVEGVGADLLVDLQLRAEPDHLDVEVLVDRLELLAQRHEMVGAAHQPAQQTRQLGDQHAGGFRLGADQRRDRGQRVEQEVRVDLVGERLDLAPPAAAFPAPASRCSIRALFQILIGVATREHRGEQDDRQRSRTSSAAGRTGAGARSSGRRAPGGAARGRSGRAAAPPASRPASGRTICQARRCRLVKTNGEKCQIASFGQSSRRPPPAKPQPTANGSALNSPLPSGGRPTISADDGAGVGAGDQAGEKRAFEREVGGVVVEQQPRGHAGGRAGARGPRTKTRRSGQSRRSKIRMWRNRR